MLLERLRLIAVIGSKVESFFSQVDVNTVLIIAEQRDRAAPDTSEIIRFVTLKRKLDDLLAKRQSRYWDGYKT